MDTQNSNEIASNQGKQSTQNLHIINLISRDAGISEGNESMVQSVLESVMTNKSTHLSSFDTMISAKTGRQIPQKEISAILKSSQKLFLQNGSDGFLSELNNRTKPKFPYESRKLMANINNMIRFYDAIEKQKSNFETDNSNGQNGKNEPDLAKAVNIAPWLNDICRAHNKIAHYTTSIDQSKAAYEEYISAIKEGLENTPGLVENLKEFVNPNTLGALIYEDVLKISKGETTLSVEPGQSEETRRAMKERGDDKIQDTQANNASVQPNQPDQSDQPNQLDANEASTETAHPLTKVVYDLAMVAKDRLSPIQTKQVGDVLSEHGAKDLSEKFLDDKILDNSNCKG